jgi:hypothetical protein
MSHIKKFTDICSEYSSRLQQHRMKLENIISLPWQINFGQLHALFAHQVAFSRIAVLFQRQFVWYCERCCVKISNYSSLKL